MHGTESEIIGLIFLLGAVVSGKVFLKYVFDRVGLPSLLAFLLLGIALSWTDRLWGWIGQAMRVELEFLGQLGLVALLFKVGLDSDLSGLVEKLSEAFWVWLGNVALSLAAGYAAASYLLGLGLIPSVITAVAFSATSVGVTARVWEETNRLNTEEGELFVDVAEMDDLSAVILMALLFSILPELRSGSPLDLALLLRELGQFAIQGVLFGAFCLFFSSSLEEPISDFVSDVQPRTGPLLLMVGLGFIIAGLAVVLGFSLAIGALFAGILFSRDPIMIREEASFQVLYEFFTPFFFLMIGLSVRIEWAGSALLLGSVLLVVAVVSKLLGAGLPAWGLHDRRTGLLLGVSMVPRAEIMLIIMKRGLELGTWAVSETLYGSMVLVALGSCLVGSIGLRNLMTDSTRKSVQA